MKHPDFPLIPGVEFKLVPEWPGYAISSDGRAWNGCKRQWRVMKTFPNFLGPQCVWLSRSEPLKGAKVYNVEELVCKLFPKE
jgi:hypothetical protein